MTAERKPLILPRWWYLLLFLLFVAGIYFIWFNPQLSHEFGRLSKRVRPDAWSRAGGILLLSIVFAHLFIFGASRVIRSRHLLNLHGSDSLADMWSPTLVGICESVMYPMALFIGKPEFIGVWLAVKVAGQWVRWKGDAGQSAASGDFDIERLNEGRRRFNGFLVGNSLSIMLGAATWGALKIWVFL